MATKRSVAEKIFTFFAGLYFLGIIGTMPFFNWQYAKENGFLNWVLLGEIVPTAKSFVWPYYLIRGHGKRTSERWSENDKENINNFFVSMDTYQNTVKMTSDYGSLSPSELETKMPAALGLLNSSLQEAEAVHDDVLEKAFPGLSLKWRQTYQRGLELEIKGWEEKDKNKIQTANDLLNEWGVWLNNHRLEMKIPQ